MKFQGPNSWLQVRFQKHPKKRDHRKLSLLMEVGQQTEKVIYEWRLDGSHVGDVSAAKKLLPNAPRNTRSIAMDPAYDAREVYTNTEQVGAKPIIKPRRGYRLQAKGHPARPRALRWREAHPKEWQEEYNRRPVVESGNYALKRRFGERLWTHGLRRQRKEAGFRILAYNTNMVHRRLIRARIQRREL